MATRATISFHTKPVDTNNILTQEPIATLYSHWDGYHEGVIPYLMPAVKKFDEMRGISDMHYAAARVIQWYIENREDNKSDDCLGYGLHPAQDRFGMGIDYHYTIDPEHVKVWEVRWQEGDVSECLVLEDVLTIKDKKEDGWSISRPNDYCFDCRSSGSSNKNVGMRELKFRAWSKYKGMTDVDGDWSISDINSKDWKIMQYTGLKDKNGKGIFEGDIVTCHGGYEGDECECPSFVEWDNVDMRYLVTCNLCRVSIPLGEYDCNEVIGNIHENPELINNNK